MVTTIDPEECWHENWDFVLDCCKDCYIHGNDLNKLIDERMERQVNKLMNNNIDTKEDNTNGKA